MSSATTSVAREIRSGETSAADLLNDHVLPFFDEHEVPVLRILTDRGTEFCGRLETHDYELYLGVNDIDHTKAKAKSPQTNGICERFHRTVGQEFYQITFRKTAGLAALRRARCGARVRVGREARSDQERE